MSEDNSGLLASNQLVGNDQPIEGVIHRGQLALAWLEQLRAKAMERAAKAGRARAPLPTPASAGQALIVLVRQVEPGSRLRSGFYLNADLPPTADDEGVAQALFDVVREAVPPDSEALCTLIEKVQGAQEPGW